MAAASGFRGVYPMLYAFFDAAGRLDRGATRAQVEYCVAGRVHGIAALGLGTEVKKLTPEERRQVVAWAAEKLAGRLPLAITVFGATPAEQIAFVRTPAEHGADWVILQPPQTPWMLRASFIRKRRRSSARSTRVRSFGPGFAE